MNGAEMIAAERQRQVDAEGWTPEHDDEHASGEMVGAARSYAKVAQHQAVNSMPRVMPPIEWPWEEHWWKPSADRVRNLVKAGALIAAEIDRIQRSSGPLLDLGTSDAKVPTT